MGIYKCIHWGQSYGPWLAAMQKEKENHSFFDKVMKSLCIILLLIATSLFFSCNSNSKKENNESKIDSLVPTGIENKIGNQIWFSKDLDVTSFTNGEIIPEAKSKSEYLKYSEDGKPAWCYVNFDPKNQQFGKLYNRFVIKSVIEEGKHIGPDGWEIPTESDFKELNKFLGKNNENRDEIIVALEKIDQVLKSNDGWLFQETSYSLEFKEGYNYWCLSPVAPANDSDARIKYYIHNVVYLKNENKCLDFQDAGDSKDALLIRLVKKQNMPSNSSGKAVGTNSNASFKDSSIGH